MKVLATPRSFGKNNPELFDILRDAGLDVVRNDTGGILSAAQMCEKLADCDGLIVGVDPVDAAVLAAAPRLRAIAKYGVGLDNIDLAACEARGIKVSRTVGANSEAVADYALALMLGVARKVALIDRRCRERDWSKITGIDLYGKTVGIIGTGKIGKVFAEICKGFGMHILAYDKFPDLNSGLNYVELPELFEKSDIISLHCPLTDETKHIIHSESIARMKKGVTIINTSRGGLINTEDLINGIKEKKVGAACLDVYEEEGDLFYEDFSGHIVQDDKLVRLIAMPNVIVTSHQAFLTNEALDNIAMTTVSNLTRFFSGDPDTTTEVVFHP